MLSSTKTNTDKLIARGLIAVLMVNPERLSPKNPEYSVASYLSNLTRLSGILEGILSRRDDWGWKISVAIMGWRSLKAMDAQQLQTNKIAEIEEPSKLMMRFFE